MKTQLNAIPVFRLKQKLLIRKIFSAEFFDNTNIKGIEYSEQMIVSISIVMKRYFHFSNLVFSLQQIVIDFEWLKYSLARIIV